jgi:integrase/recombinase XerD
MKCMVNNDVVLARPLEGPLSTYIAGFAQWTREEGYAFPSRRRKVLLAACFSRWLGQQSVSVQHISSERAARYVQSRARHVQIQREDAAALRQFLDFLRRQDVIPTEKIPSPRLTPVEQVVQRLCWSSARSFQASEQTATAQADLAQRFVTLVRNNIAIRNACCPGKLAY